MRLACSSGWSGREHRGLQQAHSGAPGRSELDARRVTRTFSCAIAVRGRVRGTVPTSNPRLRLQQQTLLGNRTQHVETEEHQAGTAASSRPEKEQATKTSARAFDVAQAGDVEVEEHVRPRMNEIFRCAHLSSHTIPRGIDASLGEPRENVRRAKRHQIKRSTAGYFISLVVCVLVCCMD